MELQELVERIQRWRLRQGYAPTAESEQLAMPVPPPLVHVEPEQEAVSAESVEEQIDELDVEPDAAVSEEPEEATSEVNLEQIEEVD